MWVFVAIRYCIPTYRKVLRTNPHLVALLRVAVQPPPHLGFSEATPGHSGPSAFAHSSLLVGCIWRVMHGSPALSNIKLRICEKRSPLQWVHRDKGSWGRGLTSAYGHAVGPCLYPSVCVPSFPATLESDQTALDIGLTVSTLPVIALGVGIGVDYGIYILSTMSTKLKEGMNVHDAYLAALKERGSAVLITGLTLAIGVSTWFFSDLKFQVDMGILLTFMFLVNMLAAIIILPALSAFLWSDKKDVNK